MRYRIKEEELLSKEGNLSQIERLVRKIDAEDKYVLDDISALKQYIDFPYTSNDVGFRKPNIKGVKFLADKLKVEVSEMAFVGDEEKDILCASNAGVCSILINRDRSIKNYGQDKEIDSLDKLLKIVGWYL